MKQYTNFVAAVTSDASNNTDVFIERIKSIPNASLLLTAAIGMSSEGGEFAEIIKKCVFQGKEYDDAVRTHLQRELGDIMWYWINACRALDIDPDTVIQGNVDKLSARFPELHFSVARSEQRSGDDI